MRKDSTENLLQAAGVNVLKTDECVRRHDDQHLQKTGTCRLGERSVSKYSGACFTLSKKGVIIDFNQAAADMLGTDHNQVKYTPLVDFIATGSKPVFNTFISEVFKNTVRHSCEVVFSVYGKLPFQVSFDGYSINKGNKCVIKISGTSPLLPKTGNVCEECGYRFAQLHKLNEGKDKLFSIIAHDLRSPFNGLLGLTEIMSEGLHDMSMAQIEQMTSIIRSSASKIYSLLDNLLEWSLMQRGLTSFVPSAITLVTKVEECIALLTDIAHKKEITVCNEVPGSIKIFGDATMIGSIFRNLLTNAIKFTPRGGAIHISAKPIFDNQVEIEIRDSGIGMDQKMIENLFVPGTNTNRKGTEDESSTGLGLMICKDFIEKHKGKFWIESEPGKGSVFYFTIPAGDNTSGSTSL